MMMGRDRSLCDDANSADGPLGQLEAKWDGDQEARARQSSIDTAQTLRLATVEALLEEQAEVGDLEIVVEVLAEGASVARDRSVEANVSAASTVREAETHLDDAIRAYRRAATAVQVSWHRASERARTPSIQPNCHPRQKN